MSLAAHLRRLGLQQPAAIALETFQPLLFLAGEWWAAAAPLWAADRDETRRPHLADACARLLAELAEERP